MKWAKFNCGTGRDAYADKLVALPSDYWAQIDVYIPSTTLTACNDGQLRDYTAFLLSVLDSSGSHFERDAIYGHTPDGGATWRWETDIGGSFLAGLTAGATHTLKVHWDGTHATWYVDGVSFAVDSPSSPPTGGIRIGGYFSEGCICEWYFVTNVKIGTSDGASDLFSEDFSGGNFSAFTSTSGSCSVVNAPSTCVPPTLSVSPGKGCFGDVITVTGSGFAPSSPLTADLSGTAVVLSPATTDGSGNASSTFTIPPGFTSCTFCTVTLTVTDGSGNTNQTTIDLCCTRSGDTIDATVAQLAPEVVSSESILDYIHHDGNHYVLVAGPTAFLPSTVFPPDWTAVAATVYVIPDDGSGISSFDITTDICWSFNIALYDSYGCDTWFTRHFHFEGWGYPIYDARFASDGTNLWLSVLTAKTEPYPYITSEGYCCPRGDPHCVIYPGQDAQFVDLATLTSGFTTFYTGSGPIPPLYERWVRTDSGLLGSHVPNQPYSDSGDYHSGHWTTPRLRMFSLSPSAATDIGYIDALYFPGNVTTEWANSGTTNDLNQSKVLSGVSVAASPAEPGVCHVVWAEGGARGQYGTNTIWDSGAPDVDYRISYSKWDSGGIVRQSDLWHAHIDRTNWYFNYLPFGSTVLEYGYTWPTVAEIAGAYSDVFQVVNDGGSPVLFIAPAATHLNPSPPNGNPDPLGNPWLDNSPWYPAAGTVAAYDISSGAPVLMQTFDPSLLPSAAMTPVSGVPAGPVDAVNYAFALGFNSLQALAVSYPYNDPLLAGQPVYLLEIPWVDTDSSPFGPFPHAAGFYRIPVDLSSTFDYLDGVRALDYSILAAPGTYFDPGSYAFGGGPSFRRFWSDAHGVWVPGGWHLDRECEPFWKRWRVTIPSYGSVPAFVAPFYWDGGDYVFSMQYQLDGNYQVSRTHICRGFNSCACPGVNMWKVV